MLFEMLTGRRVFNGETTSHLIAAVLKDEPDWSALPPDTPASIHRLLRRCLEKDRKRRLDSAAAVRIEIDDASNPSNLPNLPNLSNPSNQGTRPWAVLASCVIGGLVIGAAVWVLTRSTRVVAPADVVRFAIHDTDQVIVSRGEHDMALSPDGRLLAFVGFGEGGARIWIRALGALEARPLSGTEGAAALCRSPDGQSLAFSALGQIKTIAIAGGSPRVIASTGATSLAWGHDGSIVMPGLRAKWYKLNASGGELESVAQAEPGETYSSVVLLPDARYLLIAVASSEPAQAGTFVMGLDVDTPNRILPFPTMARYSMGQLLFVRDRVLYAQAFDLPRLKLEGEPVPLAEAVAPAFTASEHGAVVYLPELAARQRADDIPSFVVS